MTLELEKNITTPPTPAPLTRWSWPTRCRRYSAEAIGVFAIVFAAGGTTITSQVWNGQAGLVGAALASGLTIMAMIYALGHICGTGFDGGG
jgi:glycerol uptake facilitator-like aquaporin